jgi:hypothetical protein
MEADVAQFEDIPLADAISALRQEIIAAAESGRGKQVRFKVESLELELQVAASKEAGVDGGIRFWVISIGGKTAKTTERTHSVKISLVPRTAEGGDLDLSSNRK